MKEPHIYNSRWDKARVSFLRTNPLCHMCQEQGRIVAATVVDHIIPHKLKEALKSGNKTAIDKARSCIQYVDYSVKCPVLDVEYSG